MVLTGWLAGTGTLLAGAHRIVQDGRLRRRPMATGRIVAIVSAHEPDPDVLRAGIFSILDQRDVVVDEVHVVDDGSTRRSVQPFAHPRVRWHRTGYGGRRAAESYVLDRLDPDRWDYVLTADDDCIFDDRAIGHQLRAFSQPAVMATTGTTLARNARQNLLTRITDLHLGVAGASPLVAGAPILYRAATAFEEKAGPVVRVTDAIAWTRTPAYAANAYRQSLQRSASWWRTFRPARAAFLARYVAGRLVLGVVLAAAGTEAWRGTLQWPSIALCLTLQLVVRYTRTGRYLATRPGMTTRTRLRTWLLLTPVEAIADWLVVTPIRYAALLRIGRRRSAARRDGSGRVTVAAAGLGTIYYTGQWPDGTAS